MIRSLLSFAALASSIFAAPHSKRSSWTDDNCPGKYGQCTPETLRIRKNLELMEPWERKEYTDAVKCIMDQPSQLDQTLYPAAINRFFDYAVIHVNRTHSVHLDGYFLTWHRYFLYLYEEDLRNTCGYTGAFPYFDFSTTQFATSPVFDGSEFSISGNGIYNNTGPYTLGPTLTIPHGTGGGCVYAGPFAYMETTMLPIDPSILLTGGTLPPTAFEYNPNCLIRDLNQYVLDTYTNAALTATTVHSTSAANLEYNFNGVIGSSSLGVHSGAHFSVGGPMDSIHVSPQDPLWYPLHAMVDRIYTSFQAANPSIADQLSDTMTALNIPPSANVTLSSIEPDWGYFQEAEIMIGELTSTTGGPFCYTYDTLIS